ncbi:MAG: DUF308 domain-containing protein [Bacteroidales bacterium]|nr:DUF308 domain-containing protein [Bacteroidales bacterium]
MELLSKKWILILINAILVISFGLILLIVPIETIKNLVFVVGIIIAFVGLILIFGAFNYARENKNMLFWMVQGLFNLLIGGVVMFYPEASFKFLLILAGLWAIVLGVYQLSVSLNSTLELKGKTWHKINGFATILLGFLLIFFSEMIMGILIQLFGIMILIIGFGMLYFSILLKKLSKAEKDYIPNDPPNIDPLDDDGDDIIMI